jgi:hypothetical protein
VARSLFFHVARQRDWSCSFAHCHGTRYSSSRQERRCFGREQDSEAATAASSSNHQQLTSLSSANNYQAARMAPTLEGYYAALTSGFKLTLSASRIASLSRDGIHSALEESNKNLGAANRKFQDFMSDRSVLVSRMSGGFSNDDANLPEKQRRQPCDISLHKGLIQFSFRPRYSGMRLRDVRSKWLRQDVRWQSAFEDFLRS